MWEGIHCEILLIIEYDVMLLHNIAILGASALPSTILITHMPVSLENKISDEVLTDGLTADALS